MTTTVDCETLRHGEIIETPLGIFRYIRFRFGEATFVNLATNIREDFQTETGVVEFAAPSAPVAPVPTVEEDHHE